MPQDEPLRVTPVSSSDTERVLMLGWSSCAPAVIRELDRYVAQGSLVRIVSNGVGASATALASSLQRLSVDVLSADPTHRDVLEAENPGEYDHAIILSDGLLDDAQAADARTLVTLLHLRDIVDRAGLSLPIVTEMLDPRNRQLAAWTRRDDFIVSDRLISLLMAQVAENKRLNAVFRELFSARGSEIYVRPAADYVVLGREMAYDTVVAAAARRRAVALGYRLESQSDDPAAGFGLVLNPPKSARVRFGSSDNIVVLAQD